MFNKLMLIVYVVLTAIDATAQRLEILTQGTSTSIRGLSVVSNQVLWTSGSKGMVGRSVDGGKYWTWTQVPGFEKREFRDIEAFDSMNAIILAIAEPGVILKTSDGGKNWAPVYTDTTKGIFLDAFSFSGNGRGVVVGDPINGQIYLASTADNGTTWKKMANAPKADSGEACFASSGTNIVAGKTGGYYFVTGGLSSRLHGQGTAARLPLVQGKESTGANSIAVFGNNAVVVGGDFTRDSSTNGNCVIIRLGKTPEFIKPLTPPQGYRSCVTFMDATNLITCGTSGVDISKDGGNNWKPISKESFHVCQKAKNGNTIFLAGSNGRIARYIP
ncbi:MAG: oxidoreductase [Chitinophagaceae bacterium]|nr:MAG: oxidoreductase [Chitinophagaceae bacterium]